MRVRVEQRLPDLVDRDEPVVREPEDQRRMAAPAVRVAVLVRASRDEQAAVLEVADDLLGRLRGREAVQPAVLGIEAARLVDRREHVAGRAPSRARSPRRRSPARCGRCRCPCRARRRPTGSPDARAAPPGPSASNGPVVARSPTSSAPGTPLGERLLGIARDRDPVAVLEQSVVGRPG